MRTLSSRPASYYYGWNIVAICVLSQVFTNSVAFNCLALFVPIWSKEMSAPPSEIVLAVTLFTYMGPIVSPLVGWASDRFPVNRLMGLGLIISTLGYVAIAYAKSVTVIDAIYPLLFAAGVGLATTIPAQSVVSRWFDRRRGLAMGINAGGLVIGGIIFPPLVVQLLPWLGWQNVWLLFAAILGCVVAPVTLLGLFDRPPAEDPFGYLDAKKDRVSTSTISVGTIIRRPNFWVLAIVFFAVLCNFFSGLTNAASFVISHGFDLAIASLVLSVMNASALAGKLLFGALADRFGSRMPLILVALVAALGSAGLYAADSRLMLFLAAIPVGMAGGVWTVLPSALATEFGSASFGRAYGLILASMPLAMSAVPAVARVKELTGSYDQALLGLIVLGLLGAVVATLLRQPRSQPQDAETRALAQLDSAAT